MDEEVRLYISIPSNRDWKRLFGSNFAALTQHLKCPGIKEGLGYRLTDFFWQPLGNSSCMSIGRQYFVDEMITQNYTHWLSLDDDMTFPMDIVDRLISHNKDVVSCNARHKCAEIKGSCQGMDGKAIDSTGKTGIEELKTMGGAVFLAKIGAFKHIPKPHFEIIWSPAHQAYVGEDVYFASLLRANGISLWCDHDASQLIGHIGEFEYKFPAVT